MFQKLVVTAVDNEQVGLVLNQLFHECCHTVTGVADSARVYHFKLLMWQRHRQQFAQPGSKRSGVVVRMTVGGGTSQAKNAENAGRFRFGKSLLIEIGKLVRRSG